MTATLSQARDEIYGVFKAAWDADVTSAPIQVIYPDDPADDEPEAPTPWVRCSVRHNPVQQGKVTVGSPDGTNRYTRDGAVFIELYTPLGDGLTLSDTLASIARRAFEGVSTTPGDVIFRTVSVNEVGREGGWFQTNVTALFEYDEIV